MHALQILLQDIQNSTDSHIVILDDLERLSDVVMHSLLGPLLRWAPENLTVAISSRQRPPIDIVDFTIRGLLTEIKVDDLKFNGNEIRKLIGDKENRDLEEIERRTEGWPALIKLISVGTGNIRLQSSSVESDVFTEYLDANILAQISASQLMLLLETSIFDEIPTAFFSERYGHQHFLKLLHEPYDLQYLFSPIEGEINSWRIHPLLREHLRIRLREEFPDKVNDLYLSAAQWLTKQGHVLMAIRLAAAIYDLKLVEDILLDAGAPISLWIQGISYLSRVNKLICNIPDAKVPENDVPLIVLTDIITKTKTGHVEEARIRFDEAVMQGAFDIASNAASPQNEKQQLVEFSTTIIRATLDIYSYTPLDSKVIDILKSYEQTTMASTPHLQGGIWNLDALLANEQSCFERVLESGKKAMVKFQAEQSRFGDAHVAFHIAAANIVLGRAKEADIVLGQAKVIIKNNLPDDRELQMILLCLQGELQFETNPLRYTNIELFHATFIKTFETLNYCIDFFLAGLLQIVDRYLVVNKPEASQVFLDECHAIAERKNAWHVVRYIKLLRIMILARTGNNVGALNIYRDIESHGYESQAMWREVEAFAETVSILAEKTSNYDSKVVDDGLRLAEQSGNNRMLLRLLAVECHRLARFGEDAAACDLLERLAALSIQCGYFRAMTVNAEAICSLIKIYEKLKEKPVPHRKEILSNIGVIEESKDAFTMEGEAQHFTPTELRVLAELASGHSDKVIARDLNVSPNTIHFHLKNIYRKLGATSRAEAINIARKGGIINNTTHSGRIVSSES